ncbi:hypothetical protein AZH51_04055 [Branchiibius sp. NY16-3462-2]|nr:hypothetical protein AZH51_04055 [Branchiibius sp. NY16-3462-2]
MEVTNGCTCSLVNDPKSVLNDVRPIVSSVILVSHGETSTGPSMVSQVSVSSRQTSNIVPW